MFFQFYGTDGLPFREGKAIVFPTFASILDDFATFYRCWLRLLSKSGYILHVSVKLREGVQHRVSETRYYAKSPDDARLQIRTDFDRDIAEVFTRFFSGMASDTDKGDPENNALSNAESPSR